MKTYRLSNLSRRLRFHKPSISFAKNMAGVLIAAAFVLVTVARICAQSEPVYTQYPGASWIPPGNIPYPYTASPMDLAAAKSDYNSSFLGSAGYLLEFTNNGIYVFNGGAEVNYASQLQFWCSNPLDLADGTCSTTSTTPVYDPQVSYNRHSGHWIVAALWGPDAAHLGEWLFVGASQTADPKGAFYVHPYGACTDFPNTHGDRPTMGISHAYGGVQGRAVIDVKCYDQTGHWAGDEIWDIQINKLQNGVSTPAVKHFAEDVYDMTPVNHYGSGAAVVLSSLQDQPNNPPSELLAPAVTVWKLVPNSAGAASDSAPSRVTVLSTPGPISGALGVNAPLLCANSSSCTVKLDLLDTDDGGAVNTYTSGDNIFATSFAAGSPNSSDSAYYVVAANLHTGTYGYDDRGFLDAQVAYPTANIDSDDELVVNWTQFPAGSPPASAPDSGVDLWQLHPLAQLQNNYVGGWALQYSEAPYANTADGPCLGGTACRWGDYNANLFDDSCAALNAGLTSECNLFWEVTEYTTNPVSGQTQENSDVTALYDTPLSNEGIRFEGNQNVEAECAGSPCSITFNAPPGTQAGDLLLVALSAPFATGSLPSLPPGWTALGFINHNGNQNFLSYDGQGLNETGWLLAYTYGSQNPEPGQYSFSEKILTGSEVGGELLVYRGVDTGSLNFSAWGFGSSGVDNATVTVGPVSAPANNELVALFKNLGDDYYDGSEYTGGVSFSTIAGSPALTPVTGMEILGPDLWTIFAADVSTGGGGNFGPYSTTATAPTGSSVAVPLGWLVLLPSEEK